MSRSLGSAVNPPARTGELRCCFMQSVLTGNFHNSTGRDIARFWSRAVRTDGPAN